MTDLHIHHTRLTPQMRGVLQGMARAGHPPLHTRTPEDARKAYEAAGGKPASTGAQVEGAQNGETAIGFTDPTKAAKTGGEE